MISGSVNGQVWVAKDKRKIEPVARTSVTYPTEFNENLGVSASFLTISIRKVFLSYREREVGTVSATLSFIKLNGNIPSVTAEFSTVTSTLTGIAVSINWPNVVKEVGTVSVALTGVATAGERRPQIREFSTITATITAISTQTF